jgi:hypothetical protein
MNAQLVEAALSAHGRSLVVLDPGEVDDGPGSARNRGETALRCCTRHGADGAVTARGETGQMRAQMTGEPR